jgi:exosortase A
MTAVRPLFWVPFAAVAVLVAAIVWLGIEHFQSMARSWTGNGAYAHGWFVAPLAGVLLWRRRAAISAAPLQPHWSGVIALAALVWLVSVAEHASVQVLAQLGTVAMIPTAVLLCLGVGVLRAAFSAMAMLFLMVPFGEELVPALMRLTAFTTVAGLQLIGIPVYQDGFYFSIPAGDFEVAKACSGLRYLIASLTLCIFYAMAYLRQRRHQLLFIALGVIIPILANLARALLIVLLAHWSNMRIAAGIDHIIYGWIFFGVVMLALLALGERLHRREGSPALAPLPDQAGGSAIDNGPVAGSLAGLAAGLVVLMTPWVPSVPAAQVSAAELPDRMGEWVQTAPNSSWRPGYPGAARTILQGYRSSADGARVDLALLLYADQQQGSEIINWENEPLADERVRIVDRRLRSLTPAKPGEPNSVVAIEARGPLGAVLIWRWYAVGDYQSGSDVAVQLRRLLSRAAGRVAPEGVVLLRTDGLPEQGAESVLRRFVADAHPSLARMFAR